MLYKFLIILLIGAPAIAVILFEVLLNGFAMFNHSNLRLNRNIDKTLRALIVTPNMHLIHHSIFQKETDSNYGFNLSIWDRLFNTYTSNPIHDQTVMQLGVDYCREKSICFNLKALLFMPFTKGKPVE